MPRIKGIDCYFCQASHYERRITEDRIHGDCLEDIGVVIPNGGIAVVDRTIFPRVGDLVICCQKIGCLDEYIKQVFSFGKEIIVGTRYKDKTRDFTFKAEEIRGVVRYVMDDKRNIIWECERLKGKKPNINEPIRNIYESDNFTTKGNTARLKVWQDDFNGTIDVKTNLKIKHKPLKRCPYCGGVAKIEYKKPRDSVQKGFAIECKKCGCSSAPVYEGETLSLQRGKPRYGYFSFADALNSVVDKWNTRYEVNANA